MVGSIFVSNAVDFTGEGSLSWWCVELRLTAGLYWLQAALFYHSLVWYPASPLVVGTGRDNCWALFSVQELLYRVPGGGGNYANRDHTRGGQHWYIGSCRSEYCTNEMDQSYRIFLLPNSMFHHIFLDIDGLLLLQDWRVSAHSFTLPQFNYKFSTRPLMKGHFFAIIQTTTIHFQDWHTLLANLKGICSKQHPLLSL